MKRKKLTSLVLALALLLGSMPVGYAVTEKAEAKMLESSPSLVRRAAGESMVLLENKDISEGNAALPLAKSDNVALFGVGQVLNPAWAYGYAGKTLPGYIPGGGGSAFVSSGYVVTPLQAMQEAAEEGKFTLDTTLASLYETAAAGESLTADPLTVDDVAAARARGVNTAVVVISRFSTEGSDRSKSGDYTAYNLLDSERTMLQAIEDAGFEKTVVVMNVPGATDTSWFEEYGVDAALLAYLPGSDGAYAIADILTGDVNPSGKLTDTLADSISAYPSTANFGTNPVTYEEDIFVGYRYFETFDPSYEHVLYPFGYGLSYTDFAFSNTAVSVDETAGTITVSVTVTNTGDVAGKEVVQLYYSAPGLSAGNQLSQAAKELAAFDKTALLEPGASETLTLTYNIADMASYDETGVTGNESCYVLEAGDYKLYLGNSIRDAGTRAVGTYTVDTLRVTEKCTKALTPIVDLILLNESGETYTLAAGESTAYATEAQRRALEEWTLPTGVESILLKDVYDGLYTLEEFIAQFSNEELFTVTYNSGTMGSRLNLPATVRLTDGPAGLRFYAPATLLPCATLVASSWDTDLMQEMGELLGGEMALNGVQMLWGPSVNIHRNPLCGRNFEYVSEDPYLSGVYVTSVIRGIQSQGCGVTLKHFAANNQEAHRSGGDVRASERCLREIYLKPFEIVTKSLGKTDGELPLTGIMTSYNKINGVHASHRYDLCTVITRGEWGFDGIFESDWAAITELDYMVRAGHDLRLDSDENNKTKVENELVPALASTTFSESVTRAELQRCAYNVLVMFMRMVSEEDLVGKDHEVYGDRVNKIKAVEAISMKECNGQKTDDFDGGSHVAFVLANVDLTANPDAYAEMVYSVDVKEAGDYYLNMRYESFASTTATVYIDGSETSAGTLPVAQHWGTFKDVSSMPTLTLTEGEHRIAIRVHGTGPNINYFQLIPTSLTASTISSSKNTIEGESYDVALGGAGATENAAASGGRVVTGLQQTAELQYYVNVESAGTYMISSCLTGANDAHLDMNEGAFDLYIDDVYLGSVVNDTALGESFAVTDYLTVELPLGKHSLRVIASNGGSAIDYFTLLPDFSDKAVTVPTGGETLVIPAVNYLFKTSEVAVENLNSSAKLNGVTITESGLKDLYSIHADSAVTYAVTIPHDGYYDLTIDLAQGHSTASTAITLTLDSENVVTSWSKSAGDYGYTGWTSYKTTAKRMVYLTEGTHLFTYTCTSSTTDVDLMNLLNINIAETVTATHTLATDGTRTQIMAVDSLERTEGISVETTKGTYGSTSLNDLGLQSLFAIRRGRSMTYDVKVEKSGLYLVSLTTATSVSDVSISLTLDGTETGKSVALPTVNWSTWKDTPEFLLNLSAGVHVLTFTCETETTAETENAMNLLYVNAEYLVTADNEITDGESTVRAENYYIKSTGINIQTSSGNLNGTSLTDSGRQNLYNVRTGHTISFDVDVAKSGLYEIALDLGVGVADVTDIVITMTADGSDEVVATWQMGTDFTKTNWNTFRTTAYKEAVLSEGVHVLSFTISSATAGASTDLMNFLGLQVRRTELDAEDFLVFDGFQVRIYDTPGLRSRYTLLDGLDDAEETLGVTVKEIGAIVSAAEDATVSDLTLEKKKDGTYAVLGQHSVNASVYDGEAFTHTFVADDGKTHFAYTVVFGAVSELVSENLTHTLVFRGYVVLERNGSEFVLYTDMTGDTVENGALSMYEASKLFPQYDTSQRVISICESTDTESPKEESFDFNLSFDELLQKN